MKRPDYIEERINFNGFYMYSYGPLPFEKNRSQPLYSTDIHPVYDDTYIEHWGAVYLNRSLANFGIRFDYFLTMPEAILNSVDEAYPDGYLPLLPAQQRVQRKMDLQTPLGELEAIKQHQALEAAHRVVNRNGTFVERLKHRVWPRRRVA